MMGKLKEVVLKARAAQKDAAIGELRIAWKPSFDVRDVDTNELVVRISEAGIVEPFEAPCARILHMSAKEVRRAVAGNV